jgi:biotin-dependent carboxylase-like uncharacterized protein
MITVIAAPSYLTVQDLGRTGHRAAGVPPSGVMDPRAVRTLNRRVGNAPAAAVLEWAVSGGTLQFAVSTVIAVGGTGADGTAAGMPLQRDRTYTMPPGSELHVDRLIDGRFLYVAVRGGIDTPLVLGSRATNTTAAFGGLDGRRLRRGDVLPIGTVSSHSGWSFDEYVRFAPRRGYDDDIVRIVRGPQHQLFDDSSWMTLLDNTYTVSAASDRMGYRLDGPALHHTADAALPSEPTCVGAVQIPNGGTPIVVMPDGPTIGGYPKMAVVVQADLGRLAQRLPNASVRFTLVDQE